MSFNPNARLDPSQVEDRRGQRGGFGGFGRGGGGRLGGGGGPVIAGGSGIGVLVLVAALLLGVNPADLMGGASAPAPAGVTWPEQVGTNPMQTAQECQTGEDANRRTDCRVVGFVNSIQDHWRTEFQRRNLEYVPARTVLFSGATQAGCGYAEAAMGPFYCPEDQRIYLDLDFFQELQGRFGASGGPFAQAYVIAHEYGHHVQNVLDLLPAGTAGARGSQGGAVRVELQADCLAGVWTKNAAATGYLAAPSDKDIQDALSAASAVGDDRIQRQTQGYVTPDSFTHGSSQQRQQWFMRGYGSGDMGQCDTSRGAV